MNKKQIIVLWIALSILLPISYLGGNALLKYNREMKYVKVNFTPSYSKLRPQEYNQWRAKRRIFIDALGITIFEIISFTGLFIYIFRKQ